MPKPNRHLRVERSDVARLTPDPDVLMGLSVAPAAASILDVDTEAFRERYEDFLTSNRERLQALPVPNSNSGRMRRFDYRPRSRRLFASLIALACGTAGASALAHFVVPADAFMQGHVDRLSSGALMALILFAVQVRSQTTSKGEPT